MLRYVGRTIQHEFGEMNSFRIGGDEFVVLITDESEDRIRAKIEQIRKQSLGKIGRIKRIQLTKRKHPVRISVK